MILCCLAGAAILMGIWLAFYTRNIRELRETEGADRVYDRHYLLITGDGSGMYEKIYEQAKATAAGRGAYLEWLSPRADDNYSLWDCVQIGIASKADGIILSPSGEEDLAGCITDAVQAGIPVVTILEDVAGSERISFVGLNSYQLGEIYGNQVLASLHDGRNVVMILSPFSKENISLNLFNARIREVVETGLPETGSVSVEWVSQKSHAGFGAEETIRDIFIGSEPMPDILICMDAVSTESACQAILDYNQVGNVDIIGYYASQTALDALRKGVIPVLIDLDVRDVGRFSVNALDEYLEMGYVSDYFSVGIEILTQG